MKSHKFSFVFIDSDKQLTNEFCIDVLCNNHKQWKHNENDLEAYVKWACTYAKFKAYLKFEVKRVLESKYSHIVRPSEYTLYEKRICDDKQIMNITPNSKTEVIFKEISSKEEIKMVYCKGKNPEPWTKIFDYPVTIHTAIFKVDSHDENHVVIKEITAEATNVNINANVNDASVGLADKEKYLQMKKAYIQQKYNQ